MNEKNEEDSLRSSESADDNCHDTGNGICRGSNDNDADVWR